MSRAGMRESFYRRLGPRPLRELLEGLDCQIPKGKIGDMLIEHAQPFDRASTGDISYFDGRRKAKDLGAKSRASACLVRAEHAQVIEDNDGVAIICDYPRAQFAHIISRLYRPLDYGRHDLAGYAHIDVGPGCVIGEGAKIGKGSKISANAVIGPNVVIGENCRIGANVVVEFCHMGDNCVVQHGAVIGAAGFGVAPSDKGGVDIPHLGHVVIEDNVSIGCLTTIDRGMFGKTHIGKGCKFDNQVQIGHNVQIGPHCIFAAHVGISGSCVIGTAVVMGGQVGLADHLSVGDGATMAAGSGAMNDIPAGEVWSGVPAQPIRQHMREIAVVRRMVRAKSKKSK